MNIIRAKLSRCMAQRQLVVLSRHSLTENLEGFVVGIGAQFLLLHTLDECFCLNGYSAIRLSDIRGCKSLVKHNRIAERILKIRGLIPVSLPQVSLANLADLLISANMSYPLVTIFKECIDPEVCYIGKVAEIMTKTIRLVEIDPAAKWLRTRRFRLDDITRVDIGGLYEDGLLLAASHERPPRRLKNAAQ